MKPLGGILLALALLAAPAQASAIAEPMPPLAPVTRITRSASSSGCGR